MDDLTQKICKNCDNWVECDDKEKGICVICSDSEWDVFTKPDDGCIQFFKPIQEE